MNINVNEQLFNLFIFILIGIIIGILFDIFRIMRKTFKTPNFITYIEDILFWILTGIILIFGIFAFNYGEIRIYIFIGLIFGFIIYLLTLSRLFINISVKVINIIKKIICFPLINLYKLINKYVIKPILRGIKYIKINMRKLIKIVKKKTESTNFPNIYRKK